jgi:putative oxidoreductase
MNNRFAVLKHLHDRFCHYVDYLQHPFLLFVRLYWGIQLMQSGWGKLHNLDKVTDFFTSLNLPMPHQTAIFISCVEFFGGLLFAAGLLSRVISLILTVNMIMAYLSVPSDRQAFFSIFSDPDKFAAAAPYVFLIAAILVFLFGPGVLSLDELASRFFWKERKQPSPTV